MSPSPDLVWQPSLLASEEDAGIDAAFAALRRIGYDRVASVEIFRPEYWERDPFVLAREARAAVERALESEAHS